MAAMKRPSIHHALPAAYLIVLLLCLTSTQARAEDASHGTHQLMCGAIRHSEPSLVVVTR